MQGLKKEKLNLSMILLSMVMIMNSLAANEGSQGLEGDRLGLFPN